MANDNTNIFVSGDAVVSIFRGVLPREQWPTSVTDELPVGTEEVGLISEDGESFNREVETTAINSHQGANQRTVPTGGTMTLGYTAQEDNDTVRSLYYGTDAVAGVRTVKADTSQTVTVFYDTYDVQEGYEKHTRIVGVSTVTPDGAIQYTRTAEATYPLLHTFNGDILHMTSDVTTVPGE